MKGKLLIFLLVGLLIGSGSITAKTPSVAIVANDAIGDRGFTDMAFYGLQKAVDEFKIKHKMFECHNNVSNYYDIIKTAASNYDVVILDPGYFYDKQLEEIMRIYPKKAYVYIDGAGDLPGVISVVFKQNEGAFLAGALAAMLTTRTDIKMINKEKKVGFVGGADWPVIRDYQTGFEQGVKYIDPSIKVIIKYAGDHFDPAKGKETAYLTYQQGADVIFQAAGPTGLGVLQAAADYGFYAIGVDTDQGYLQPGYIVSSMLKRVDTAVYTIIEQAINNKLEKGALHTFNVKNNGVGMAYNEYFHKIVPGDIHQKMLHIEEQIAQGKIVVGSYLD